MFQKVARWIAGRIGGVVATEQFDAKVEAWKTAYPGLFDLVPSDEAILRYAIGLFIKPTNAETAQVTEQIVANIIAWSKKASK